MYKWRSSASELRIQRVYILFWTWCPKFLLHFACEYRTPTVTMFCRTNRIHYNTFHGLKEVVPLDWKRKNGQIEESLNIWVEAIRRLQNAGKCVATITYLIIRMAVVDLDIQQNKAISNQLSVDRIRHYEPSNMWPEHMSNIPFAWESGIYSRTVRFTARSICNCAVGEHITFSDKSCLLCPGDYRRRVWRRPRQRGILPHTPKTRFNGLDIHFLW